MSRVVNWVEMVASSLGGSGLFVVAFLDSSFLSLPEINDILVVLMVTRNKALMTYYASMATLGSIAGCLVLHGVGRRGGEALVRKRFTGPRVERALALFHRFGVLAIIVPALLPPPMPFKLFVLISGVARVRVLSFVGAVAVGRGMRYFGEGALAVRYGDQTIAILRANGPQVALVLVVCTLVGVGVSVVLRRHRRWWSATGSASDV